ncbi:MAG: CHASE3 domain-containing protein [Alphaproteobacteria bacterium]|nr:CHASE3 domain-containing protein [Alphaproteobacteria bacterium]
MTFSRRSFRLFSIAGISFLLACLAMLALLGSGARLQRAVDAVETTYQVLHDLERLHGELRDAETAQRGYLLTGNPAFTVPLLAARHSAMERLERLARLVADKPAQQERLRQLVPLVGEKLGDLDHAAGIAAAHGLEAARGVMLAGQGRRLMVDIRDIVHAMVAEEEETLVGERRDSERLFARAAIFGGAAFLLSIPVLVLFLLLLRRDSRAQQALARELAASNEELNRRVAERTAELEEASRARDIFFAKMSHELRTPLNAVIGFADMIATETLGPVGKARYKDYAADIRLSGEHLLSLINDILDAAKSRQGMLELEEQEVEAGALVESMARLVVPRAARRDIRVVVENATGRHILRCDPRRMRQILLNLLSNAVKFTPDHGEVRVGFTIERAGPAFHVADTGVGMSREELRRALTPFGQAGRPSPRDEAGTGLGLPLTRELVELHGGELQIETAPGKGTLARVRLPIERLQAEAA